MKITSLLLTSLLLLAVGCADEGDATVEETLPVEEVSEAFGVVLPLELEGSLTGKTVVLVVTERFFDPEYREVRGLFELAGAEVLVLSDLPDPTGEGGSEVVASYRVSQIAEMPRPDAAYILHSGSVMALPSYPEFVAWLAELHSESIWLAASGVGARVLGEAGLVDGVTMSVYVGQVGALEEAGAVLNTEEQVTIDSDGRIGSCTFWPKGGQLTVQLIETMAAE